MTPRQIVECFILAGLFGLPFIIEIIKAIA
jgi:hypothetical protein